MSKSRVAPSVTAVSSLQDKLEGFAKTNLSKDEFQILNAILGTFKYSMTPKNREILFADEKGFLEELHKAQCDFEDEGLMITPTWTLTTLTTTVASHPIITCSIAVASDNNPNQK